MPRFRYKAVNQSGEVVEGDLESPSRNDLVERLRRDGYVPIRAEQLEPATPGGSRHWLPRRKRVTPEDMAHLTRELAVLLRARLPLDHALSVLGELSPDGPVRALVSGIQERIRGGATLADALSHREDLFPDFYIGMVRAGEASGSLDTILTRITETMERSRALQETIKTSLQYPAVVLVVTGLSLVALFTLVIPQFRPLFEETGAALPLSTEILFAVSDGIEAYGVAIVVILLALIFAVRAHNRRPAGRLRRDALILKTPLLGDLVTKVEVSRFSRTFGMLLANGVSLLNALSIVTGTITNRALRQRLERLAGKLSTGESLAVSLLELRAFPRLAVQLIHSGEESGQLEEMLLHVADIYEQDVHRTIQRSMTLLVPIVTIVLGLLVAAIIGSMLVAILESYNLPF